MTTGEASPQARPSEASRRILLLIDDLECGGAQQMVVNLATQLVRQGYFCLVCVLHPQQDLKPRLLAAGVEVVSLNRQRPSIVRPWRLAGYVLACLYAVCRLIRREKIDVVHGHQSDAEFLAIAAGRLCRVRCAMATVHSQRPLPQRRAGDPRNALRALLTRFLFNRADAVAAVSQETADLLRRIFGIRQDKLRLIPNGIAPAPETADPDLPPPRGRPSLCAVGRLAPQKNHAVLFAVLRLLLDRGLDPRLRLVGDGPLRASLEAARDACGLTDRVCFLGQRDDVAAIVVASDVFVFPSFYEGTSLALLEAMAAGRPIVASDVAGNRDILRPGETALLCPPDDAPCIADAIARLIDDPALAKSLADAARRVVAEKYSIEAMTNAYLALWNTPKR